MRGLAYRNVTRYTGTLFGPEGASERRLIRRASASWETLYFASVFRGGREGARLLITDPRSCVDAEEVAVFNQPSEVGGDFCGDRTAADEQAHLHVQAQGVTGEVRAGEEDGVPVCEGGGA